MPFLGVPESNFPIAKMQKKEITKIGNRVRHNAARHIYNINSKGRAVHVSHKDKKVPPEQLPFEKRFI